MENVIEVYMREDDVDTKVEPQTIKDLFTEFKPSTIFESEDSSNISEEDSQDESDTKCMKRRRKSKTDDVFSKKRMYLPKYRKEWETIPAYKPWLSESVFGSNYFYCKFCKNNNKCGRTEIEKHMSCRKHIRNSKVPQHRVQKKFTFRGLLCSVFTPFKNKDNDVNYAAIRDYAKYLLACGVKGVLLNDVVGEGMSLTTSERIKVLEEWIKICEKTKQHLMVQVGGGPLKDVLEMVKHAERKKVDSIIVLPDLYNKPKDHFDLMRYIKLVSDCATSIPLLYHHYPSYTGVDIDMAKFLSDILGEIDSFVGIIFNDNNLKDATSALLVNQDKFTVFIGADEIILGACASGFASIMVTSLNFVPHLIQNIYDDIALGKTLDAQKSQSILNNVLECVYRHGEWLPALKAAMNLLSPINVGPVRDPLVSIWQDKINKMKIDLQQLDIFPGSTIVGD
ncbi:hypothetical protein RN001_001537 [Aquatica leii]|uniref:N-acetylneuraminate lyase n=1 Tax=Aquatica leii TaxID=1421715 RepID=A0AAN7PLB5_9COLE|nr:hypothetical protein RN001_001537 [Aquatica leii]